VPERFNLLSGQLDLEQERPGFNWRAVRVGDRIGGSRIGGTIFELGPGERVCPYHFHHGVEELVLVLAGEPLLRTPAGERTLQAGDLVAFPRGPEGAHSLQGPGRILLLSANREPSISAYPDSDKLGTRPGSGAPGDGLNFRRADAVDYWDGE
jgi:uncharacterized cupin superfamily protein